MKTKTVYIPSYQKQMPEIVETIKRFGGKASVCQIGFTIMADQNIPRKHIDKVFRDLGFARTFLKKVGIIIQEKRGIWKLSEEYVGKDYEEMKVIIRKEYNKYYNI